MAALASAEAARSPTLAAIALCREIRGTRSGVYGEDHWSTVQTVRTLATLLDDAGLPEEAAALHERWARSRRPMHRPAGAFDVPHDPAAGRVLPRRNRTCSWETSHVQTSGLPHLTCAVVLLLACACGSDRGGNEAGETGEETKTMLVQYLEIVTADVDATCASLENLHGVRFGEPEAVLGNARTATLRGGGRVGVRAPMREDEERSVLLTRERGPSAI